MDKRTVLAFALIFLVYMGWMKFYEKNYRQPPGAAADSAAVAADTAAEPTTSRYERPAPVQPAPTAAEVAPAIPDDQARPLDMLEPVPVAGRPATVVVQTPLYELELSAAGARITRWLGLEYPGPEGGPVSLIPGTDILPARGDAILFQRRELELGQAVYTTDSPAEVVLVGDDEERSVVFVAETYSGLQIRKTFTFNSGRYDIGLEVEVAGDQNALLGVGDPVSVRFAWQEGIASTEQDKKMEAGSFRSFALVGEDISFKKRQDLAKDPEKVRESFQGTVQLAGLQNKYFLVAGLVAQEPGQPVVGSIHLDGAPERNQLTWAVDLPCRYVGTGSELRATSQLQLFVGPSEVDLLKLYGCGLERTIDFGPLKIFHPLASLVLTFIVWMYQFIPNYGVIIVLFSVLTKILFYPLTRTSTRSMKKMQELQPKIKALQEKYKDKKEKLSQETMKLYREEKVNPMSGCLPILVQSPVFIALFQALRNTIALRQAPFALWIDDLAQPDAMFQLPIALPILGANFNLLPILLALSMYFQTKLTPTAASGGQMAIMNTMMPILMLVFFYNMPSGLVLYWLVNTLMTIYQTWRIHQTAPTTGGAKAA